MAHKPLTTAGFAVPWAR